LALVETRSLYYRIDNMDIRFSMITSGFLPVDVSTNAMNDPMSGMKPSAPGN
jgi:hypothetical protein